MKFLSYFLFFSPHFLLCLVSLNKILMFAKYYQQKLERLPP